MIAGHLDVARGSADANASSRGGVALGSQPFDHRGGVAAQPPLAQRIAFGMLDRVDMQVDVELRPAKVLG
jgi:hypothetical protein